ncbi:MAG: ketoacyl-ACP synthase III [Smithella sp.]|nr:ketoacyl-ACP synthase III [Smithella sp.]
MSLSRISGIRIAGVAAAVPDSVRYPSEWNGYFGADVVAEIVKNTGVQKRYISLPKMCCSDLCVAAAKRLMEEGNWTPGSIDAVIFLSQNPDYRLPCTAALIQRRLELPTECAAFDINLGCSGYVYGLWLACSLIAGGGMKRILFLSGDASRKSSSEDRAVGLLFGDAGSATIIERSEESDTFTFVMGTDGRGANNLIIPAGGARNPSDESTRLRRPDDQGNLRSQEEVYMNGAEIFAFTLKEVPRMIERVLAASEKTIGNIDSVILHQANKFMLEHLAKRMKIPAEKLPLSLGEYGNTSSASIPVTMIHCLREQLRSRRMELLLGGFGVGYSWGAVTCAFGPMVMPEVALVGADGIDQEAL